MMSGRQKVQNPPPTLEAVRSFFDRTLGGKEQRIDALAVDAFLKPLDPSDLPDTLLAAAVALERPDGPLRVHMLLFNAASAIQVLPLHRVSLNLNGTPEWERTLTMRLRILEQAAGTMAKCPVCGGPVRIAKGEGACFWRCASNCGGTIDIDNACLQRTLTHYAAC